MRILNVIGARPNFVKIAPLLAEMRKCENVHPILVHTGQHHDGEMSDCFLRDLDIPPPDFEIRTRQSDAETRKEEMRTALRAIMRSVQPDFVVVVGDVDSSVAGALAAHDLNIPVAHVEAGLRSFDFSMPEEINRIGIDSVSTLLFASEPSAVENLLAEGYPARQVFFTGNVMIDALRRFQAAAHKSAILAGLGLLDESGSAKKYILATLHRPGAVDDSVILSGLWAALEEVARSIPVVFPAHPRTRIRLQQAGLAKEKCGGDVEPIRIIPPQPYFDFMRLQSEAALVMTDSGGVQEETTALGVPCLTLRNNTERPITVSHGTNQLVGLDRVRIVDAARQVLSRRSVPGRLPPLWDGHSAERIVCVLQNHFGSHRRIHRQLHPPTASQSKPVPANFPAAFPA